MVTISITTHYINVLGIKTFYEEITNNCSKTIVCFHSEGRESRQYHAIMEELSSNYNVVAFDMPAHGKTWPVEDKYPISDWDRYVDFAWNFLVTMHLENAILLGCGLGASVILALAQTHSLDGIVLISATENSTADINYDLINHPHISTPHMFMEYNKSIIGNTASKEAKELIKWQAWCETAITLKEDLRMLCHLDMTEDIKKITCPVLMIKGEDDWTVTTEESLSTINHMASESKEYVVLPGVGRFAMIEAANQVSEKILEFFGQ